MNARMGVSVGAMGASYDHIQMTQSLAGIISSISILHIVLVANPMTEAPWLCTLLRTPTDILDLGATKSGAPSSDTWCVSELFTP